MEDSQNTHNTGVKTAIILAAGNGSRIQDLSSEKPKPLLKLGGLLLIERAILNLHAAGIEKIRVVVGFKKEQIITTLQNLKSLKSRNIKIDFIECADYEKGNGASMAAGVGQLNEPFLLTMSDHVMSVQLAKDFLSEVKKNSEYCCLATDPNIANVFDLDDATKVQSSQGSIENIGKELKDFDCIDTGLFYFSKLSCEKVRSAYSKGAYSVSEIVGHIRSKEKFRVQHISPNAFWQDVDTPSMAREAEKRMLNSLRKPTDGWVSKNINRYFSLKLSRLFSNWGVHPNVVTTIVFFVFLPSRGCIY
jgi:choline kinase